MSTGQNPSELRRCVVVIPCLNEEDHIEQTLNHFMAEPDGIVCKIVVADGGSTDQTLGIVEGCAARDSRIVMMHNTGRIQSCGMNRAVEAWGDAAPFIVRVDAHAAYPSGFCASLLAAQEATGADSVVVSMIAKGKICFQQAAAAAQNSLLGNGGSAHRRAADGRFVDHGHHALMSVAAFRAVGGYDETFSHNEDAELDWRLKQAGFRIYLCGGADITYYPRTSPLALFRQYWNFGRGRAKNAHKHRVMLKLRQMLPILVGPAVAFALLGVFAPLLAVPALSWALICIAYGISIGLRKREPCACGAGLAAMIMHLGFSFGFLSYAAGALVQKSGSSN
ncbi:glycosyltransferase family 2 protein [Bradyrhizobium sp. STM 3809]|uniref:glycosyltransferase family 2 protein n=1 Tax=Bradyrhizobium sp. STM 3809 TaxID=551936 RepID=UPI0002408887|nr:glycosyltransferase family 2 protein [Bradyrhizobium sp. STM 3809]CCE00260.1 Succinoglycan biosynthesis protein exoA [Bradyrhizobium sp. STM 3809]